MPTAPQYARILVLGGARSGKSGYAASVAESSALRPVFLATAEADDAEMGERIARHQQARSARWRTIEEPLNLLEALRRSASPQTVVVIDCMTLWLSNLFAAKRDFEREGRALVEELPNLPGPLLFVSNEVGSGIVPTSALGREFRDAQGRLNQRVAASCDTVVHVVAGLPLQIKPAPSPSIRL